MLACLIAACDLSDEQALEVEPTANVLRQLFPKTEGTPVKKCPGKHTLLGSCRRLPGTTLEGANWLECWRASATDRFNILEIANYADAKCCLTPAQMAEMADACKAEATMPLVTVCVGQKVQKALNDLKNEQLVCRHHARCLKQVLGVTKARVEGNAFGGISAGFEGGVIEGDPEGGHAWTEIGYGGALSAIWNGGYRIFADAYNGIYFECEGRNRTLREAALRSIF